jgi:flagellar protein FliO/FliZ
MQALSNLLVENRALMISAAAVAFFVAAVLILLVFRLAFGRRLRMPGGRARQMRLGIVDAFDLDRQRQLVIVRRDNIEHLVMIGGPNDILIESQIIRTEARPRDKEIRERDPGYVQGPAQKPHAEPKLGPPLMPEHQPVGALEDHSLQPPPGRAPPPPPGPAPGQRRGPFSGKMPSVHETPPPQPEYASKPQRQAPPPPPQPAPAPAPAGQEGPAFMRWPARPGQNPAPQQPLRPGKRPATGPQPPAPPPPRGRAPQHEPQEDWPAPPSVEGLESLEEEMAKLLGRGPNKS